MENHRFFRADSPAFVRSQRALARVAGLSLLAACHHEPPRQPAIEPDRIIRIEGEIEQPSGAGLIYRAILAPDPKAPDQYLGTVDIPKQALEGASLERVVFQPGQRIEFELALVGSPRWTGEVNADGTISCAFQQGEITLGCSMYEVRSSSNAGR